MQIAIIVVIIAIILMATTNLLNIFDSIVIGDIFLRLLALVFSFVTSNELISNIDKVIPNSLLEPIETYTTGTLYTILIGVYILCYAAFMFTLIKRFVKRR